MAESNVERFFKRERTRLEKQQSELIAKRLKLQKAIELVRKQLDTIGAFDRAVASCVSGERLGRKVKGKRQRVLAYIKSQEGLSRGDIIRYLRVKGNKREEQSISNALAALKKAGTIRSIQGKYFVA